MGFSSCFNQILDFYPNLSEKTHLYWMGLDDLKFKPFRRNNAALELKHRQSRKSQRQFCESMKSVIYLPTYYQ